MNKVNIEIDLERLQSPDGVYLLAELKSALMEEIRGQLRTSIKNLARQRIKDFVEKEFLEGKVEVRDGVVYIPLLLADLQ
jgi:hypothetical protein